MSHSEPHFEPLRAALSHSEPHFEPLRATPQPPPTPVMPVIMVTRAGSVASGACAASLVSWCLPAPSGLLPSVSGEPAPGWRWRRGRRRHCRRLPHSATPRRRRHWTRPTRHRAGARGEEGRAAQPASVCVDTLGGRGLQTTGGQRRSTRFKIQDKFIRPVVNTYYYTAFVLLRIGPGRLLLRPVLVAVAAATRFIFKQVLVSHSEGATGGQP